MRVKILSVGAAVVVQTADGAADALPNILYIMSYVCACVCVCACAYDSTGAKSMSS